MRMFSPRADFANQSAGAAVPAFLLRKEHSNDRNRLEAAVC
uniref:Uncharacterized protein n=1 Tax=Siphoviridae sp. ctNHj22 TaxID=2825468 RepID=A0A8S5VFR3_9CAUD|nr:MAG TPA: hypothetical protein [Siphoviridae sp. ctNHj22]